MAYESVDKLQKVLAEEIFSHTKDPKKAAGRALGTFIEIITYFCSRHGDLIIKLQLRED